MVRVFDEKLDAKTYFYTGGDERNVSKDRAPVPPGVPAALGGKFAVEPVKLPPEAWYPGLKPFVRKEETEKRSRRRRRPRYAALEAAMRAGDVHAVQRRGGEAARATHVRPRCAARPGIAADDVEVPRRSRATRRPPREAASKRRAAGRVRRGADAARAGGSRARAAKQAEGSPRTLAAAEKRLTDAKAKVEAAQKALDAPSTTYTPLSPIYPKTSSGRRAALAKWITVATTR